MSEALKALLNYEQADEEGVMVLASREAIHVVSSELDTALTRIRELERVLKAARDVLEASESEWEDAVIGLDLAVMRHDAALSSKDQEKTNG